MEPSGLVLGEGDVARASGRVVASGGDVWFEPPLPVSAVGYPPGHEPPPRPSGLGVRAGGVDIARLSRRFERDGAVAGWATLTGIWHGGRLDVTEQTDESVDPPPARDRWVDPPCVPPPHGWPQVPEGSNIEPGPPEGVPGVVGLVLFRPTPTQVVLVVTTSDPAAAEAMLRPTYGDALCVVPSRWSRQQLDVVRSAVERRWQDWGVYQVGDRSDEDGQVTVETRVVRMVPEIAAWWSSLPAGIADVEPWLRRLDAAAARPDGRVA